MFGARDIKPVSHYIRKKGLYWNSDEVDQALSNSQNFAIDMVREIIRIGCLGYLMIFNCSGPRTRSYNFVSTPAIKV